MQYPAQLAQIGQQITQIILTSPEPETLLSRVAMALGEIFQVDICLVATAANLAAMPQVALWVADGNPAHPGQQAQLLEHPVLKNDWVDTAPLAIFDLHAGEADKAKDELGNLLPMRAMLKIHTQFQSSVNGMIVLGQAQPYNWTSAQKELLIAVSASVAVAISQAQLRQVQSLVADRTAQLQQSLEVQEKLYEKTRQQIDQLQQLNLLKDEFLSSMSHELRTPLTTMSLGIRMLRQPQLSSERREKYLEILEQECNKEIDLINDLLSLQRLESNQSQLQPQKIDLMLLLQELAEAFEEKWVTKGLTLTVESSVSSLLFNTEPDSLNRILIEVLTNAGKYSDPDTTICLQVTHQVQQSINQVILTLSNTGLGISPTDITRIFEKFHRGPGVTQKAVQGTGLGLALVKCLVQHLNGTIEVTSSPLNNSQTYLTAFTLTLPQLQKSAE